jgi:hypothetical protein
MLRMSLVEIRGRRGDDDGIVAAACRNNRPQMRRQSTDDSVFKNPNGTLIGAMFVPHGNQMTIESG